MKTMKKVMFLFAASVMIAACGGKGEVAPLAFESYENTAVGEGPEGGAAGLELKIDIPVGEGERQDKVAAGIREIISQSEVGKELKQPVEGSLKEIADAFLNYFPVGVAKGDLESSGAITYHLWIENESQNSEAVFFRVGDGIFSNGGPSVRYAVIRLSDGKLMDDKDVYNITGDDIVTLVKKYGTNEQKEFDEAFIGPDGYLCPVGDSCKVLYLEGAHFWNVVTVPFNEVNGFLTEEGKKLFLISENVSEPITIQKEVAEVEPEAAKPAEPGRGELGIFDLRGPVKSCKWKNVYGEPNTYTFDENGFWQTKDGKSIKKMYHAGIDRDKTGRIVRGDFEFYDETFTYNEHGLLTETVCDGVSRTVTYDADGYVKSERYVTPPDMGDDEGEPETTIYNYTIVEKDEIGNWTKRKCSQGTETRTIEYYQ